MATSKNLDEFSRVMAQVALRVERNAEEGLRRVAVVADQAVVLGTPVDTGRARSNWIVSLNSPSEGERGPYSPGTGGTSGAANAQAAIAQGQQAIAGFKIGRDRAILIVNNLPYIGDLNAGSSAQAPAGFVEQAILRARSEAASIRLLKE